MHIGDAAFASYTFRFHTNARHGNFNRMLMKIRAICRFVSTVQYRCHHRLYRDGAAQTLSSERIYR